MKKQANGLGAAILFAEAKSRVDEILRLVDEYNEIKDAIVELGYPVLP